ncbi:MULTISPECIES: protein kinase [unclassified Streptomyces]|uniref:serine/threonine-protein kinase n=1 Tax=unclassified Streptomyces TaxID=2593676 RepID=UPI0029A88DCA|nr:protein kinase [Streptomyces sp. DK15]MDX2389034.1 protein kinase [Streptomyces sp. DK15]
MRPVIAPLPGGAPAQLGGHRILGVLGSGGMGTVYLARRRGRPVALKTIRPELFRDADLRARFGREAAAAAAVRSPFVAAVLGSSTDGQVPWLAAEFVPGATLADGVLGHGPLPAPAVRVLAAALGRALTALGGAGVVHRDLKPSNVILGADRPRVVDFGIARVTGDATLTATGQRPGTPGYMSPEQVVKGPLGPPSDVFCLGTLLVFALTGRHAFFDGDPVRADFRIAYEAPDLAGVPSALLPVIRGCLEKRPADRPTAAEVTGELDPQGAALRRATGWLPPAVTADATEMRRAAAALGAGPRLPSRRRFLAGAGAAALLTATGTTALPRLRDGNGSARPPAPRWSGPPGTVPQPLWTYDGAAAEPAFGPVGADGAVWFADGDGATALRDPVSGERRGRGPTARALVGGRRPVALAPDGTLLFLDAATGAVRHRVPDRVGALLAADEDRAYVLDDAGHVAALGPGDRGTRWRVPAPVPGQALVAATGQGLLLLASEAGGVAALSVSDGRLAWRRPAGSDGRWSALSARVVVVGGGGHRALNCLGRSDGEQQWTLPADDPAGFGVPALAGDTVYVADGRQLRSIDVETGAPVWTVSAVDELAQDQAPLVAGSAVFVPLRKPELGILVVDTGRAAEQYAFAPVPAAGVRAETPWRGAVVRGGVVWQRGSTVRVLPGM